MSRAVVFDLDDTLYPYEDFVRSGFRAVSAYLSRVTGVEAAAIHDTLSRARLDEPGRELQALITAFGWPEAWVPRLRDIVRFHRPVVELWPDARLAMALLRSGGWRVGILTNGTPAIQRAKVRALDMASRVDAVVYAEASVRGGKPARRAFDDVVARLGVDRSRAVMVGDDAQRDVRGATAAGLHAIHLVRGRRSRASGPLPVASTLAEACAMAERLVPDLAGVPAWQEAVR